MMNMYPIEQCPGQAVVGRVKSWLTNPERRLPVSCTVYALNGTLEDLFYSWSFVSKALRYGAGCAVNLEAFSQLSFPIQGELHFQLSQNHPDYVDFCSLFHPYQYELADACLIDVADTMDEVVSGGLVNIEESWTKVAQSLMEGQRVVVNLSPLRPRGAVNGKGLVASGPASFAMIYISIAKFLAHPTLPHLCSVYSTINEILRRGGTYRNGAVTLFVHYEHPEAKSYLNMPRTELEWAKRALVVDDGILSHPLLSEVMAAMESGDLFLAKKRFDSQGQRLFSQVCMEIFLQSRDTCTLHHVNLGELEPEQIPQAFVDGMTFLCQIHRHSNVDSLGIYLSPSESKQVGLGILGLANYLAIHSISYKDFVIAFESLLSQLQSNCWWDEADHEDYLHCLQHIQPSSEAHRLAISLMQGYMQATAIAKKAEMQRAFTIAPTASSAFQYRDSQGYCTVPNIAPPIACSILRDSQEFGILEVDFHPGCETAAQVGFDTYFRLACCFQTAMDLTGLAHAISFDIWDQQPIHREFLQRWLRSPLWTTYYRLPTLGFDLLDKSRIQCDSLRPGECIPCAA